MKNPKLKHLFFLNLTLNSDNFGAENHQKVKSSCEYSFEEISNNFGAENHQKVKSSCEYSFAKTKIEESKNNSHYGGSLAEKERRFEEIKKYYRSCFKDIKIENIENRIKENPISTLKSDNFGSENHQKVNSSCEYSFAKTKIEESKNNSHYGGSLEEKERRFEEIKKYYRSCFKDIKIEEEPKIEKIKINASIIKQQ